MRPPRSPKRIGLFAFLLLLVARPSFAQLSSGSDPWLAEDAFIGGDGCLVVSSGQHLAVGDRLVLFRPGRATQSVKILRTVSSDSAKAIFDQNGFDGVYHDPKLWKRVGCWWGLRNVGSFVMASYQSPDTETMPFDAPLALSQLSKSAVTVGANGTALTHQDLEAFLHRLAHDLPRGFAEGTLLLAGWHFGHDLVEVEVGKPFSKRPKDEAIDSVRICQCFLLRGHLLAMRRFQRVSGVEEHEDQEAPELNRKNWNDTSSETLGFLSLDGGMSWNWIYADGGFEGIGWSIVRLTEGTPERWGYYLPVTH